MDSNVAATVKQRHASALLAGVGALRESLWRTDCTILVGSASFQAHAAVLAACSGYLRTELREGFEGSQLEICGVISQAAKICIDFMYSGEAGITADNVFNVLQVAHKLNLEGLIDLCLRSMQLYLTMENCSHVRQWYRKLGQQEAACSVTQYIGENFNSALASDWFRDFCSEELAEWLDDLELDRYELIWKAVKSWVNFNSSDRDNKLEMLLQPYFTIFPPEFFVKDLEMTSLSLVYKEAILSTYFTLLLRGDHNYKLLNTGIENKTLSPLVRNILKHLVPNHLEKLSATPDMTLLSKDAIFFVLRSVEHAEISSEKTKWKIVSRWVKYKFRERVEHFASLFSTIRLARIEEEFYRDVIMKDPLMEYSNSLECRLLTSESQPHPRKKARPSARHYDGEANTSAEIFLPARDERRYFIAVLEDHSLKIQGIDMGNWKVYTLSKRSKPPVPADAFRAVIELDGLCHRLFGNAFQKRNEETKNWLELKSLPEIPTRHAKLVAFHHRIYVIEQRKIYEYDPDGNVWETRAARNLTGGHFCACATRDALYILGGDETPKRALKWDKYRHRATETTPMIHPRVNAAAAAVNGKVFVMGGSSNERAGKSLECYDQEIDGWMKMEDMMVARWKLNACVHGDKIYVIGGAEAQKSLEIYNTAQRKWEKISLKQKIGIPFTACIVKTSSV